MRDVSARSMRHVLNKFDGHQSVLDVGWAHRRGNKDKVRIRDSERQRGVRRSFNVDQNNIGKAARLLDLVAHGRAVRLANSDRLRLHARLSPFQKTFFRVGVDDVRTVALRGILARKNEDRC